MPASYGRQWLAHIDTVDWFRAMFPAATDELDLDRSSWPEWQRSLASIILAMEDGCFLTLVAPPLDRPFPSRPTESLWNRVRGRRRYWPTKAADSVRAAGLDVRLVPRVQIFRYGRTLAAVTPSSVEADGWFGWNETEFAELLAGGWKWVTERTDNPEDLHWFGPAEDPGRWVDFLSNDQEVRHRVVGEVCALSVVLFERALGLPDPTLVRGVQQRWD